MRARVIHLAPTVVKPTHKLYYQADSCSLSGPDCKHMLFLYRTSPRPSVSGGVCVYVGAVLS